MIAREETVDVVWEALVATRTVVRGPPPQATILTFRRKRPGSAETAARRLLTVRRASNSSCLGFEPRKNTDRLARGTWRIIKSPQHGVGTNYATPRGQEGPDDRRWCDHRRWRLCCRQAVLVPQEPVPLVRRKDWRYG